MKSYSLKNIIYKKSTHGHKLTYKLLLGIISIYKETADKTFKLKICGIRIFKTSLKGIYKIYYILFIPVWKTNASQEFLNDYLNQIIKKYKQYDEYYIFLCRSGEFYLLMHHILEYIQNNKSKNYIFIVTARYHVNICKMFFNNIDIGSVELRGPMYPMINRAVKNPTMIFKNKKIFMPFYWMYLNAVEEKIRKDKNAHYYALLKQHLNLSNNIISTPNTSKPTQEKIKKIAKYILNSNFVIFSPESLSNQMIEKSFWEKLANILKKENITIYVNCMNLSNRIDDCISMFLTYEESIELSRYARAVVGLRSGFMECLSISNPDIFVLYTNFPPRIDFKTIGSDEVMRGFSIKNLPNVINEKVFEININDMSRDMLIEMLGMRISSLPLRKIK